MDTDGTCQLCNTTYWKLDFLTCRHNQIAKLVDDDHYIRHKLMSILRIEFAFFELLIIFLDVSHLSLFKQIITSVHHCTKRIEGFNHSLYVGDDSLVLFFKFCEEVIFNRAIDTELHLLRVNHHNLKFRRMFLVKQ